MTEEAYFFTIDCEGVSDEIPSMPDFEDMISDSKRLMALKKTGLLDSDPEEAFDRITNLACRALNAPAALVSLVDEHRQFFKSACGLPEKMAGLRETPNSHAFCKHVVSTSAPFIVNNSLENPLIKDNPSVSEMGVMAYLGFPIRSDSGHVIGSLCVLDFQPRNWTDTEIGLVEDLAAVVKSEIDLRVSRDEAAEGTERLELLLDSASEGIYGIDPQGNCTFCNPACVKLLGYDNTMDIAEKNVHRLIHHTDSEGNAYDERDCPIFKGMREGTRSNASDDSFIRKDGSKFPVEYHSSPIVRKGKILGAVVIFTDITQRQANERKLADALERAEDSRRRAERADREKSRFLANMSHEIRTPMNAVIGFTELLEPHVHDPKPKRYLDVIRSSGSSLLNLINDILDLSKIESAEVELNPQPCNVRDLGERIRLLFSQKAQERDLRLEVSVSPDVPTLLTFDEERIRQVIVNLIGNSIKFTEAGTVSVNFSTESDPERPEKVSLIITVKDTGVGIDPDDQKKIFKPFHQGSSAGRVSESGTGLGLSISRSIVELCDGRIDVSSKLGEGSTFTIRFPSLVATIVNQPGTEKRIDFDFDDFQPASILIVDDNMINRELLGGYFDGTAHSLSFAENGEDAVKQCKELLPDIVLMDIRMPGMSGSEAREIIASDAKCVNTSIIAVTASSMMGQERRLRNDFDGYIRKPLRPMDLYYELQKFLPKRAGL